MSKLCPIKNEKVLYLDCLECEDKICKEKERKSKMKVYVCQEENCSDLALECGPVNQQTVFDSPEKAIEWLIERIKCGEDDGFVKDSESETSEKIMKCRLEENKSVSITMFFQDQDNWSRYFDIVINPVEVQ